MCTWAQPTARVGLLGLAPLGISARDRRNKEGKVPSSPVARRQESGLGVSPVDEDPDLGRRVAGGSPWRAHGGDGYQAEGCAD
jgi:hypothetical protein